MPFVRPVVYRLGEMQRSRPGCNPLVNLATSAQTADSAQTISANAISAGIYLRSGLTAGRTDTTDTAANILAANPDMSIGDTFVFIISNTAAQILTLAGGTGVTVSGRTTVNNGTLLVLFTKTSETTMTAVGL